MKIGLIPVLLSALAATAAEAKSWTAPEGCEIFMTVQSKGCRVSNHYHCSQDAPGDQWRADFDQEGVYFYSRINRETEWVESYDQNPTVRQTLDPGATDPARFSELLATGLDTFAFELSRDDGSHSVVSGFDRLTGKSRTIDGIALEQTEYDFTEMDDFGNILRRARGHEFISRDMRMFFSGPGETDLGDGQWLPFDGTPMEFAFPGDKGFATTQPIYDCDALTAGADTPTTIWRVGHGQ